MNFHLIKEWIKYVHYATDEHSLHSPFFYNLYLNVIKSEAELPEFKEIELQRQKFLQSNMDIIRTDFGAGSKRNNSNTHSVKSIARNSLSSSKFSIVLHQLIAHFKFKNIIELGTSLGINTAYMALNKNSKLYSFEGDPALLSLAEKHLSKFTNVEFIRGNIDHQLKAFLASQKFAIDLIYFDANHTYEATISYFCECLPYKHKGSIFIFDDIYWSKEMTQAWKEIQSHPEVVATIDLFDAGLVFFNPSLNKEHLVLSF